MDFASLRNGRTGFSFLAVLPTVLTPRLTSRLIGAVPLLAVLPMARLTGAVALLATLAIFLWNGILFSFLFPY